MQILVRLGEPIWRAVEARRLTLEFDAQSLTVADVLAYLAAAYPNFASAYRGDALGHAWPYQLFVNARIVPAGQEASRYLNEGDKLFILLPAVGGAAAPQPLPRSFFSRPTLQAARDLLGQRLVRQIEGQRLSGRIVEVEAYIGEDDRASHAARGRTARNWPMYGPPGRAYVYFIYGMYHCLNVVTEAEGFPAAVLLRALEPLEGVAAMAARRPGRSLAHLADGPGKLCQALAIDLALNGHDLTSGAALWLEPGPAVPDDQVILTPRIGVIGDQQARAAPWRFVVAH